MNRCRIAALLLTRTSQVSRKPGWLATLTVFAIGVWAWGQQPPAPVLPAPPAAPAQALTASPAEALALDRKIIAEAKDSSEIPANLAYLSDIIGPRLTGSAALKRANEWTAEKIRVSRTWSASVRCARA